LPARRRFPAAAVLACLLLGLPASADVAWVKSSPGGGGAFLSVDVSVTGKVLVGSDLSGAYLRNGTANWKRLGKYDGINRTYISCVRWSPITGDTALVSCRNGIFRSLNAGDSWQAVNGPSFDTEFFSALGWSRSSALTIYAAGAGTSADTTVLLWKSSDGGANWTTIGHDLPTSEALRALKLVVHPSDPNTIYMVTGPDGLIAPKVLIPKRAIYKSTNGGINWMLKSGADEALDVAVHPTTPGTLLMTTSLGNDNTGQVKRSVDGGDTWTPTLDNTGAVWWDGTKAFLTNIGLDACGSIPANAGRFQSLDGGFNWARVDSGATWEVGWSDCQHARGIPFSGVCNALSAKGEYWVTPQFVWHYGSGQYRNAFSTNVGPGRWITTGIDNVTPVAIADAQNAATLYAGYYDIGLWRTQDNGASWTMINPVFPAWGGVGGNVTCVVADSARPGVVWAAIGESSKAPYLYRVYRSSTSGSSWPQVSNGLPYPAFLYGLTMDRLSPAANRRLWITANGALYRSTDDGLNWTPAATAGGLPSAGLFEVEVDPRNSNLIYVGGWSGLWRSADGGNNWIKLSSAFDYSAIPGEIGVGNTLLHRVKWHGPQEILFDPFVPGKVWVTSYVKDTTEIPSLYRGLYMSTNDGVSWTELRRGPLYRGIAIDSLGKRAMVTSSPSSSSGSNGNEIEESKGLEIGRSSNGTTWTWALDAPNPDIRFPFGWEMYAGGTGQRWMGVPGYGFMRKPNAPIAVNDAFVVGQNSAGNLLPVLANDSDPDLGDTLSLQSLNLNGAVGSGSIAGTMVSYTPPAGFVGVDHFGYTVKDLAGNTASATVAVNVVSVPAGSLAIAVAANSDDAEESATGSMNLSSTDLDLTFDLSQQKVGMRFNSVAVPQGTTITSAYIQFTTDETSSDPTTLTVHGQASDNAPTFGAGSNSISARPLTSASVAWAPVPWTRVAVAGPEQRTSDLSAILTEIFARPGWASGQSLAIIITGPGRRVAQSWDFSPAGAPVLHLTWGGSIPVGVGDLPPHRLSLARAPGAPGRLAVDLSLMDGSAAELDVIDVTGRRIVAREVGSLGAGSHRVEIADRLASGVYLLRLRQGAHTRTLKAVVLN
jgi:hypothetical protein